MVKEKVLAEIGAEERRDDKENTPRAGLPGMRTGHDVSSLQFDASVASESARLQAALRTANRRHIVRPKSRLVAP